MTSTTQNKKDLERVLKGKISYYHKCWDNEKYENEKNFNSAVEMIQEISSISKVWEYMVKVEHGVIAWKIGINKKTKKEYKYLGWSDDMNINKNNFTFKKHNGWYYWVERFNGKIGVKFN